LQRRIMKTPDILLAKSLGRFSHPAECRLVTHTMRVVKAAKVILALLSATTQPLPTWWFRLRKLVLTACIFHDIGKANSAFQTMRTVRSFLRWFRRNGTQPCIER